MQSRNMLQVALGTHADREDYAVSLRRRRDI